MKKKPIVITQHGCMWMVQKGKTVLAFNFATDKFRWSPEHRVTIDDQVCYESLLHVQAALEALKVGG